MRISKRTMCNAKQGRYLQREFEKREAQIKEASLMWSERIQEVEA